MFFSILFFNQGYSQELKDNVEKLKRYKTVKVNFCESYGNWSYIYTLQNGKIVQQENLTEKTTTLIQKNIYDSNDNIIHEIKTYDINNGKKIDTAFSYKIEYDNLNRIITKRFCGKKREFLIERFSDFNEFSQPKLIERLSGDGKKLYFGPFKEILEYDTTGNLINETKFETKYPEENEPEGKISIEINRYKYDSNRNIIEIKREFNPKINFPINMVGGLPLYETEKFEYKYNKEGLWTKKYWTVENKKYLIEKRDFTR
jgi:predicted nucleic-acid-binding protein